MDFRCGKPPHSVYSSGYGKGKAREYSRLALNYRAAASRSQVSTTVSGFSDSDTMPSCANH
jgi:hypothetical protein